MRLHALERELAAAGFLFHRQRGSHLVYRNAAGHALTITNHPGGRWGSTYCRGEVTAIRRTIRRLLAVACATAMNS